MAQITTSPTLSMFALAGWAGCVPFQRGGGTTSVMSITRSVKQYRLLAMKRRSAMVMGRMASSTPSNTHRAGRSDLTMTGADCRPRSHCGQPGSPRWFCWRTSGIHRFAVRYPGVSETDSRPASTWTTGTDRFLLKPPESGVGRPPATIRMTICWGSALVLIRRCIPLTG